MGEEDEGETKQLCILKLYNLSHKAHTVFKKQTKIIKSTSSNLNVCSLLKKRQMGKIHS